MEPSAKRQGREMAGSITLWYRRRFNLTPNDPRFLNLTPLEILTEYHAHLYDDLYSQGKLDGLAEDDDFDLDGELHSINEDGDRDASDEYIESGDDEQWEDIIHES